MMNALLVMEIKFLLMVNALIHVNMETGMKTKKFVKFK